jgi:hypothetical protein
MRDGKERSSGCDVQTSLQLQIRRLTSRVCLGGFGSCCEQVINTGEHIMQKNTLKKLGSVALVTLSLGYGSIAAAAQENVIVVLDATGTMQDAGDTAGTPKWDIAKAQAKAFVNMAHSDREYELWTFSGSAWTRHYSFANGAGKSVSQRQADVVAAIDALSVTPYATPLAMTVCDAVDALIAHEATVFPPPNKRIFLETDGLENNTPSTHACYGASSTTTYDPASTAPRGGLTANSWEWKVLNKAITGNPTSTASPPPGFEVVVDVTALFTYIPTASLGAFSVSDYAKSAPMAVEVGPMGNTFVAPLSDSGVAFFHALAEETGGRYVQIDPSNPPPTPGDVDSSGCTDYGDYVQIMQWYGQAVDIVNHPQSDLADLTRDGFVNYADYMVVVQNWGTGPTC